MKRVLVATITLIFAQCASSTKKPNEPVTRQAGTFAQLIERANAHTKAGTTDRGEYQRLVEELGLIAKENPKYTDDEANKKLAVEFVKGYPQVQCDFNVAEPDEKLMTSKGYASPVIVNGKCPVIAPFVFEADSIDMALAAESLNFKEGNLSALIRVNSATPTKEKNKIRFSARYYTSELLSDICEAFKIQATFGIVLSPPEYVLSREPTITQDTYAYLRRSFRKSADSSEATTGTLTSEVAVSETGQFTIGGAQGGKKFDLLYGHPNGNLPDGIGTSFTTVRVDGVDYRLEEQKSKREKNAAGQLVAEMQIGDTGVVVIQTLSPVASGDRVITRISYEIKNNSRSSKKVGIRLLLDTWAGHDDGVPFLLPIGDVRQLYRTEVEFTPSASVMWQIYDTGRIGKAAGEAEPALQNILVGKDLVPPDRVAFANWPEAAETLWDYAVSPMRRITGDSAVLLWWQPQEVKPGASQTVATDLGAYLDKHEPAVFVTNADTGELIVYLWHYNSASSKEQVAYTVKADKGEFAYSGEGDSATLESGEAFIKANAAQIIAEGTATITITETIDGRAKEYKFTLENLKQWKNFKVQPVVEPSKQIPVSYFDTRDMELKARLKAASGKVVKEIPLVKKAISGGFEYTGSFDIPADADAGRYNVEVVK